MSRTGLLRCPKCGSLYRRDEWSQAELMTGTPICFECAVEGRVVNLLAHANGKGVSVNARGRSNAGAQKRQKANSTAVRSRVG